jgi:hypothetical protein
MKNTIEDIEEKIVYITGGILAITIIFFERIFELLFFPVLSGGFIFCIGGLIFFIANKIFPLGTESKNKSSKVTIQNNNPESEEATRRKKTAELLIEKAKKQAIKRKKSN